MNIYPIILFHIIYIYIYIYTYINIYNIKREYIYIYIYIYIYTERERKYQYMKRIRTVVKQILCSFGHALVTLVLNSLNTSLLLFIDRHHYQKQPTEL